LDKFCVALERKIFLCDFFGLILANGFAMAQNTGAQNAQSQKSNFEPQAERNQNPSLSMLLDAVFENPRDL